MSRTSTRIPEEKQLLINQMLKHSEKKAFQLAWQFLCESGAWNDPNISPKASLLWPRLSSLSPLTRSKVRRLRRSMDDLVLRPVSATEYFFLINYLLLDRIREYKSFYGCAPLYARAWKEERLLGAFCQSAFVGYVVSTSRNRKMIIDFFEIFPPYQRLGLGRRTLLVLEGRSRALGLAEMTLESVVDAKGFYKKVGFIFDAQSPLLIGKKVL
jgi:GNAT superfamily N-acetyltransferase